MNHSEQLRAAIVASKRSQYALAKSTGVSQSLISRLLSGGSINWENGCKLAAAVGHKVPSIRNRRKEKSA